MKRKGYLYMSKYSKLQEKGWRKFREWQKKPEVYAQFQKQHYNRLDKMTFMALWTTDFKGGYKTKQIMDYMTHTTTLKTARTFRKAIREEFDVDVPLEVIRNEMDTHEWLSQHKEIADEIKARYHAFVEGGMSPSAAKRTIGTYYFGS